MKLSVIALLMCVYITTSLAEVKKKSKNDYSVQKKSLLNQLPKKEKRDFVCQGDVSTIKVGRHDLGCWEAIQNNGAGFICGGYPDYTDGWRGQCCQSCAHLCSTTVCGANQHCVVGGHTGECRCDEGYTGDKCDVCDDGFKYNFKSMQCEAPCRDEYAHCEIFVADGACESHPDYLHWCRMSCGVCKAPCLNRMPTMACRQRVKSLKDETGQSKETVCNDDPTLSTYCRFTCRKVLREGC